MTIPQIKAGGKRKYMFDDESTLRFNSKRENTFLGSQGHFPFKWYEWYFNSSEHLYQFLGFVNCPEIQTEILSTDKPFMTKFWGNYNHENKNKLFWDMRIDAFRYSLVMKAKLSEDFRKRLLKTKKKTLVEYCYWNTQGNDNIFAAHKIDNELIGYNVHGRLLMQIREQLENGTFDEWCNKIEQNFEKDYLLKTNCKNIINIVKNKH